MKTNVELNSPQEEGIYKSKQNEKDKDIINRNEDNSNINNININENEEKNKEDKNQINNGGNENNNNENIIEKKNVENIENNHKHHNINDIINNVIEEEKNEEDPLITYITSNRKISDEEIKNESKLILEEIDGTLLNGKKIKINAGGMVDGRNKKDGFTIFGQKKCGNTNNSNSEIQVQKDINNLINNKINNNDNDNDIFIPDIELNYSKYLAYPYIFAIYFKREEKQYYIRAYCGKGSDNKILFIKLSNEDKYILKQKELISAGNIIFQVHAIDNKYLEIINLTNKKHSNCKRVFDGLKKKIVTIGRHKDCDFFFQKINHLVDIKLLFNLMKIKKNGVL